MRREPALPNEPFEFARPFSVDRLGDDDMIRRIEATADERRRLAKRFGLPAIDRLEADITVRRVRDRMIEVSGRLQADIVQTCVVTLEPFPESLDETFTSLFSPDMPQAADDVEIAIDPEAEDDLPEPLVGGRIDIGELTAQHLSLALDPYPRRPGVEFADHVESARDGEAARPSPFATLARLRQQH